MVVIVKITVTVHTLVSVAVLGLDQPVTNVSSVEFGLASYCL